jgi:hypothetical protein
MSLFLRGRIWWSRIMKQGIVLVCSTKCTDRESAEAVEAQWTPYLTNPDVRFWDGVDKNGPLPSSEAVAVHPEIAGMPCWPWTRGTCTGGYGKTSFAGKIMNAHRLAWFLAHGEYPEHNACHKCDNPPCCNPAHLFDGDDEDNANDMLAKGRGRFQQHVHI